MRLLQSTRPTESKNLWKVSKLTIQRIIGKVKNTPWKEFVKTKLIWRDLFEKTHKKTCQVKTHWMKLARKNLPEKNREKPFKKTSFKQKVLNFSKNPTEFLNETAFCLSELKSHLNLASLCFLTTSVSYIYFPLDPSEMMFLFTMRKSKGE